jgi:CBS-domain-containing membrane protein
MRQHIKHYIHRHEPPGRHEHHLKSGLGAIVAMLSVGGLATATGIPLLIAPFGATAVLLFGQPKSPLAQPANVVGGYLVASFAVFLSAFLLPDIWWSAAISVGFAIAAMSLLRLTHPPAGAIPLVAFGSHQEASAILFVVIAGGILLVTIAVIHHRLPPRTRYPLPAPTSGKQV